MATRDLTNDEMVGLSGSWVADQDTHQLLSSHHRTAGMVADLSAAHTALVKAQSTTLSKNEKLTKLLETEVLVDERHDRKARGVNLVLTGLAELAESPEQRAALIETRALLFPEGVAFINLNYAAEAGVAEVTRHRLAENPAVQASLAALPSLDKHTLADEVAGWLDAGDQLRQLESQRRQFSDQGNPSAGQLTDRAAVVRARNRWIRVINALTTQIELDESPDPKLQQHILDPLHEAMSRAEGRIKRAARTTAAPGEPPPAPGEPPPAPGGPPPRS